MNIYYCGRKLTNKQINRLNLFSAILASKICPDDDLTNVIKVIDNYINGLSSKKECEIASNLARKIADANILNHAFYFASGAISSCAQDAHMGTDRFFLITEMKCGHVSDISNCIKFAIIAGVDEQDILNYLNQLIEFETIEEKVL